MNKNQADTDDRRQGPQERRHKEHIGAKIRYQRVAAGLTQAELGREVYKIDPGPAQTRIKKFELGQGREPNRAEIKKICKALQITINELTSGPVKLSKKNRISFLADPKVLEIMPDSKQYMEMINLAITNDEMKLVAEIVKHWLDEFNRKF